MDLLGVLRIKDSNGNWVSVPGLKGDTGEPFKILGIYATAADLEAAVTDPEVGDVYLVGTTGAYDIYLYLTDGWHNTGRYMPKGDQGDPAPQSAITSAVETWLAANVDPETGYVLDRTLSQTNAAAPADLVGDVRDVITAHLDAISEYKTPVNLFNKNSSLIRNGYKFTQNGDYSALSGSSVSHPIKVKANTTYCYKYYGSYYGETANRIVRRCDAEGNLIQTGGQSKNAISVGTDYGYFSFTEEELQIWEYFCVMFRTSGLSDMIIAEGDTLPAYSEWFEPYYKIKESALPDSLPLPVNMQANPLYGKKAAFTGDSICYGAGATGGYAKIIGENNNMTIFNSGRTGATLATGTTADGVNRGWICNMVGSMPTGYDYYIVEGGVNDAALDLGVQLGSMSSGYTATLDTTTLYGAMETICKILQTTFLGKKYGFLIPHKCYGQERRWNTEFRPAMKECLKKWGIPYLDLSENTAELNNVSALRVYTSNGDGWHPTEEGYRLFYVDKIEAWMKTL